MSCADMGHLVFLPTRDAALTRRAKSASRLAAIVVRFSRPRGRYERQGILVEEGALERAEVECLADEDSRARRRERDALRRADEDVELRARMAQEIGRVFRDELLMSGLERGQARAEVRADVARVLDSWRRPMTRSGRTRIHGPERWKRSAARYGGTRVCGLAWSRWPTTRVIWTRSA